MRFLCPWDSLGKNTKSGLPCPSPGNLPDPGIEPASLTSPALAGRFFTTSITCIKDSERRAGGRGLFVTVAETGHGILAVLRKNGEDKR